MTDGNVSTWETVKAHLVLSVIFGLVASILLLGVRTDSELDGFLLFMSFILLGAQQGVQVTSEDIYIYNSVDKSLVESSLKNKRLAELSGATLASLFSYLFSYYAQPSLADVDTPAEILTNTTMRTALAVVLLLTGILNLMLATCMFKETPI